MYGVSLDNTYIQFLSVRQLYYSELKINNINDKLSFKYILGDDFICAMIIESKLEVHCLKYEINPSDSIQDSITIYTNINSLTYDSISSFGLYDTNDFNIKILCRQNEENIYCNFFKITISNNINYNFLTDDN